MAVGIINAVGEAVKQVTGVVDEFVTTKEEKQEANRKIKQVMNQFALDMESEITARHKADMTSDSWLSKNIRPMSLIFTTGVVTLFAVADGNIGGFTIKASYIALMKAIMMAQYTFYFGSRALEKYNAWKANKEFRIEREKQRTQRAKITNIESVKKIEGSKVETG